MTQFKKIITKEWFKFFIYSLITLFTLVSIATLVTGFLRSTVTVSEVFISYFIDIPFNLERIIPISCLIASLFSVNKLKDSKELTAIFSSGFSQNNYISTVFSCVLFVSVVQFGMNGFIKPYIHSKKDIFLKEKRDYFKSLKTQGLRASTLASGKIWYKSGNYFLAFSSFNSKKGELKDVSLFYYDGTSKVERSIMAKRLIYQKGNSWLFEEGTSFNSLNNQQYPEIKDFKKMYTYLQETPADLVHVESDITTLNFVQLFDYIDKLEKSGLDTSSFKMTFYETFSGAIISIIFALFALYPIFNPSRRQSSFGKNAFFVFALTLGYWFINSYFVEMGKNAKLIPVLASFTIPICIGLYTLFYFNKNQRLSS